MAGVVKKSFGSPDERRTPDKSEVQVVDLTTACALTPNSQWKLRTRCDADRSACERQTRASRASASRLSSPSPRLL